ncbi:hypothetical protein [Perlucidibaca piscinae]|uniref:hypothetical protein n=1 Tax=Perlucidibaca piscinae TaxID=392589 RepID=UPI0003B6BEFF|nr:hypothetical protein [Perlucidibaca piscinae]
MALRGFLSHGRHWLLSRHRRLALWVFLPALAWSLTGLLHPVMSRWQPSAVAKQPPVELVTAPAGLSWKALPPPASVLPAELQLRELRALTWRGVPFWMAQLPDGSLRHVDARNGKPAEIERELVEFLARHYTGESVAAVSLSQVTAFSAEYPVVNRYLPVWRVAFDRPDGLVAFIEPRSLQLAALTDTWKTRFSALFGNLHSWKWWAHEPSRDVAMVLALGLIMVMAVAGVARVTAVDGSARPAMRRWHGRLGLLVTLAVLAWCVSGMLHVLVIDKGRPGFVTYPLASSFRAGEVVMPAPANLPEGARLQVLATPAGPLWHGYQLMPGHLHGAVGDKQSGGSGHLHAEQGAAPVLHEVYASARTGERVEAVDYARMLAADVASGARWLDVEPVTRFTHEYGFVQKRLPVYKVRFDTPDTLAVYVDPVDAAVASVVHDADRVEGFSFAYLHKVNWLDFLGKDARDLVAGVFSALVFAVTLWGLLLWRRR